MTTHYTLKAETRDQAGKGVARSLRRTGKAPAVIYGDGKEPVKISLCQNDINVEYGRGHMFTSLCDLEVDGKKHLVLARDIQLHPVSDIVEHVDFLRVNEKTKIAVMVPVHFINEDKAPGLKDGGVLNIVRHDVELHCIAVSIPESIDVNLEGKDLGDAVKISDAILPQGTSPVIKDHDFTIATLMAPKAYVEEEIKSIEDPAATAEGATPAAGAPAADAKGGAGKDAKPAAKPAK
jgi:large subunit ribosomal protein L25